MHSIPTLIIGGGIAGASLAYALAERGAGAGVTLVDVDLFGRHAASATSAGAVHAFFPDGLDVRLAIHSIQFFRQMASKIDFRQVGALWLYDPTQWEEKRKTIPEARVRGVAVLELTPRQAKNRFSWLGEVDDLGGAIFAPLEGHLSLHKLRMWYLNHAQAAGVTLMDHWQVVGIEGTSSPFLVTLRSVGPRSVKKALTDGMEKGDELTIQAGQVVNAAGPWAPRVAALYGRPLPVAPRPHQLFLVRSAQAYPVEMPYVVDGAQGIEFRQSEFDRKPCLLVSASVPGGTNRIDFTEGNYQQQIEPRMAGRFPSIAGGEAVRTWVSHEEPSQDGRAVVGRVPARAGLFNFAGLSSISQCHMLAEAMAGLVTTGDWPPDLDLEELGESRFDVPAVSARL
jgi:sarcosine oxidase subunit beta